VERGAGVPITLASDAHVPEHVAHARHQVVAAARSAGYDSHLRFASRVPIVRPLSG
jgi:histidinol phosphatase-like PHP family hydrolase